MKIYISGAMSGIKNNNRNEFYRVEKLLSENYPDAQILNPHKLGGFLDLAFMERGKKIAYSDYMNNGILHLLRCTHICMIAGWTYSKGAKVEYGVAKSIGLKFIYSSDIGK